MLQRKWCLKLIEASPRHGFIYMAIYLFGSFASGTATNDSDYDFYVIVPDGLQPIEVTWKITGSIPREIKKTRSIDMLVGTESKFNKLKDILGFIENQVVQTGVRLYR